MSTPDVQFEQEANAFFQKRLGACTLVLRRGMTETALDAYLQKLSAGHRHPSARDLLQDAQHEKQIAVFPLNATSHLLVGALVDPSHNLGICLSVQTGPADLASRTLACTIEAWELTCKLAASQLDTRRHSEWRTSEGAIKQHRIDDAHPALDLSETESELPLAMLEAMSRIIDARDHYTRGHSDRVAALSYELAKRIGLSDAACQEVYLSGRVHDIGKIGIPDAVLLKDAKLTDEEFDIVKQHPEIGYRILEGLPPLQFALPVILHHHERWDGRGYPHGLIGEATPLLARIVSVADAFDAMTSSRIYRRAMPDEQALHIIQGGRGSQWDSAVAECLVDCIADRNSRELTPSQRTSAERAPLMPPHGIIPQDSSARVRAPSSRDAESLVPGWSKLSPG